MKLRIKGNSLQIQLTRSEIERFEKEGYIEANTAFVSSVFTYALQIRPDEFGHELSADFKNCILTMYMPEDMAKKWIYSDVSSCDTWMEVDNGERLYLLLEKDFKSPEEEIKDPKDSYQNPLAYRHN